ncbi:MAG TPA: hypothetical protein VN688_17970 [Gemmataceae bacterium]|nr:hypothetical protein [Gemmataceae bacterium]
MRTTGKQGAVLIATALALAVITPAVRSASPLAGNWKVAAVSEGKEITLLIIKVEDGDGKPAIKVLWPAGIKDTPLEDVSVDANSLRFTLRTRSAPLRMIAHAPKGEAKAKKLLGSVHPPGNAEPLILERTDKTETAAKDAEKDSPGFDELERALEAKDAAKQEEGLKALVKKRADAPVALAATEALAQIAIAKGATADKIRSLADQYVKTASVYGRDMELHATLQMARGLLSSGEKTPLALDYAQKAEKQLTPKDSLDQQAAILKTLTRALNKAGKGDEAKTIKARIAKLDERLDEEFEKRAIPFKLEAAPRRKGNSERVVLLELFTGTQCPPCVAADIACDAVLKSYKPSEVVVLQYHLHIPGPDPLTNTDSVARQEYYGKDIEGTPTAFLDGKPTEPLGGPSSGSKESYDSLRKQLDGVLQKKAGASIKLDVQRTGDKINVSAEVADLTKTGDRVRLRFALVEEVVRYPGPNGQRLHHHVVRSFIGSVKGYALLEATEKQKLTANLADVKKSLNDYLTGFAKANPFPGDDWPLNLKRLKVVAFVQDDKSKEILQAVQTDVPEAK